MTLSTTSDHNSVISAPLALGTKLRVHIVTQRFALAIVLVLSWTASPADAQVYEPGATVLGKTTPEHFADLFNWMLSSRGSLHTKDSERVYENQKGPVFFLPRASAGGAEYEVIDIPYGAPMAWRGPITWVFDHANNLAEARTGFSNLSGTFNEYLRIDGEETEMDFSRYVDATEMEFVNRESSSPDFNHPTGTTNGAIVGRFVLMEPLTEGMHRIEYGLRFEGVDGSASIPINVFVPDSVVLKLGENYSQDFNSLGTDGERVKVALPTAWTVTDEWGFALQRDTDAEFPISTSPRPGAFPYVTNAGVPGEEDRALSIYMPRDTESVSLESPVSQLQFLAEANGAADSLQVQFDIEAWDASSSSRTADPGEAAFDVTLDIDAGNGFEPLLDLGHIATGQLQKPTGDYLNGNDAANRVSFDSGVLPATIPSGSQLRFRWAAALDGNSDGWVFGIDNFAITLLGEQAELVGDLNGDGALGIDDLNSLTTAIQAASVDTQYDLDGSGVVDLADRQYWVTDIRKTWLGDSNLDGVFDSEDMIAVFSAGEYEDALAGNSTWSTGDWDGDREFDTADLIAAFSDGGYEAGSRAAVAAVPEPSTALLALIGLVLSALGTQHRGR